MCLSELQGVDVPSVNESTLAMKKQLPSAEIPLSKKIKMVEHPDGVLKFMIPADTEFSPEVFAKSTGIDFRYVDGGENKAIVWTPGVHVAGHTARLEEVKALIERVLAHTKTGAISKAAKADVLEMFKWLLNDYSAQLERSRSQAQMTAALVAEIDALAKRKGARVKLANDPKQEAKREALRLWLERHEGKCPKLRTVEQFATEVMRRWPILKSSTVICGWSAKWSKAIKAGETPAC